MLLLKLCLTIYNTKCFICAFPVMLYNYYYIFKKTSYKTSPHSDVYCLFYNDETNNQNLDKLLSTKMEMPAKSVPPP